MSTTDMRQHNKGRPSLGITRKVSLTLPSEAWEWLDLQQTSRSEVLRGAVMNAMNGGQVDIYEAIKKAQAEVTK